MPYKRIFRFIINQGSISLRVRTNLRPLYLLGNAIVGSVTEYNSRENYQTFLKHLPTGWCFFDCNNLISHPTIMFQLRKADIRNPLSLLAHERSRFATCQWELLTPTDISIPLIHRLVLYALEMGWGNAYSAFKNASHFCCEYVIWHGSYGYLM